MLCTKKYTPVYQNPKPELVLLLLLHHVFYINFKHQLLSHFKARTLFKTIFEN